MQQFQSLNSQPIASRGGGRVSSPAYRQSLAMCEDFSGLEADVNRYDLLLLVKRVGRSAGFTPRMIQLLDHYLAFTRDQDWQQGARPIVFQSLSRTALDLGVSERQVQKLEQQLFAAGAITWNDSGNHKRYGQRDPETGRLLFAFGVELTPLGQLKGVLQNQLHQKQLRDQAWLETKRQISWYRRQIRSLLLEHQREEGAGDIAWLEFYRRYDEVAVAIRTHLRIDDLRQLLARHKDLHAALLSHIEQAFQAPETRLHQCAPAVEITQASSCRGEQKFVHYNYTIQELTDQSDCSLPAKGFQESVAEPPAPIGPLLASGLQHIKLGQALEAASPRFAAHLPFDKRPTTWNDVVEAAWRLRPQLGISQASWAEACEILGRAGAAVCVLLTDQAALRLEDPARQPAAYFRGMINKARDGQLRLHSSIFGLIEKSQEAGPSAAALAEAPPQNWQRRQGHGQR